MSKSKYLAYIKEALIHGRETYSESINNWKQAYKPDQFLGMYTAPGIIPVQVQLEGFMYHVTGDLDYACRAKEVLLEADTYLSIVPAEHLQRHPEYAKGVPVVEAMFQAPHFLYGYLFIKDSGVVNPEEKLRIEQSIRSCIDSLFHYPEWGAHNRSMLRVWTLSLAIEALGETEETSKWNKMRTYLAEESFGKWSIEDAQLYLPLWLGSCQEYARYAGREEEYFKLPQTKYYYEYFVRILTPGGLIPDYGDSHFGSFWYLWLACLEKGAAAYQDGHMKYAADQVFEFGMAFAGDQVSIGLAAYMTYAYLWADDEVAAVKPDWGSEELLEDVIGKKIVFRDGWNKEDTYLLLNYRDEGNYANSARSYLRNTISVKAEKAHHGHSDENSVSMLIKDGNVLLYEGGYREQTPNGKYRNDIYHNRLVFREGELPDGSVYDFLHDHGHYKKAVTEKLHMQKFEPLEYSRTRLYDVARKITWDRNMTYIKEDGVFIVVDWTRAEAAQTATTANLWHTGMVLEQDDGFFDTCVPHIYRGPGDTSPYINRNEWALAIEFPGSSRAIGQEAIKRCYGDAVMLYEVESGTLEQGSMRAYVTVLTPHRRSKLADQVTGRVSIAYQSETDDALSLVYRGSTTNFHLSYKLDLEKGLLDEALYPRYTWEDGKVNYGRIVTDADFAYVLEGASEVRYGFMNGSRIELDGKELFATPKLSSYQFESRSWAIVDHKWRAWDGSCTAASN